MTRTRRSWPWWRWALTGLSGLGLALSGYLGWHYLMGGTVLGCDGGSPCEQVLSSRWSSVGGALPVSGLAMGDYLALLLASLFIGRDTEESVRRLAWRAMLVLSGAAAGSAVWFIIVQKWFIGSFCPYCMTTHVSSLLVAGLVMWQAPRQGGDDSTQESSSTTSRGVIGVLPAAGLALTGLALAGILAFCQLHFTPPAAYRGGEAQDSQPALDPHNVPLTGSPDAPYVVMLLFDYNCPHCQRLHFMLDEAIRRYQGKLAFILCPTPLNTRCNPFIPRDVDEFKDSCELAQIGLAVWVAKREAFPEFNRWMFSLESGDIWRPRSLNAARAKAIELVGQEKFDAAQANPWISQYIQNCVGIYGGAGGRAVPKLIFGARWVTPELNDADELLAILHSSLAVPNP